MEPLLVVIPSIAVKIIAPTYNTREEKPESINDSPANSSAVRLRILLESRKPATLGM